MLGSLSLIFYGGDGYILREDTTSFIDSFVDCLDDMDGVGSLELGYSDIDSFLSP